MNEYDELLEREEEIDDESSKDTTPKKFNLSSKIQKESINLGFKSFMEEVGNLEYKIPKYQRSYVWKKNQIEALVFSLLMDYPIPPIYVYVEPKTKERYILDGQQRVISLYLYFSGYTLITNDLIDFNKILPDTKEYKEYLDGLDNDEFDFNHGKHLINYINNSEYKKKLRNSKFQIELENLDKECFDLTYKNLSREVIIELNKKTLNIVTVKTIDENENENENSNRAVYCEIFNLLNNGGTPLKPQEIRNAIYSSDFYNMLHEVNENNNWKKIVGKEHKHSKHVELLLRFCSLYYFTEFANEKISFKLDSNNNSIYQGAYPQFLNFASEKFRNFKCDKIEEMKIILLKFINKFEFDNKKKFPPLMLESLFVVSKYKKIEIINNSLQDKILSDVKYKNTIINATSSKNKLEERLNVIYENC